MKLCYAVLSGARFYAYGDNDTVPIVEYEVVKVFADQKAAYKFIRGKRLYKVKEVEYIPRKK